MSVDWIATYPLMKLSLLKRSISDHCPLLLAAREQEWGPRPFRFLNCWLSHLGCLKLIKESWAQSQGQTIIGKLKAVKNNIKKSNTEEFGSIEEGIASLENKIHDLESLASERLLTELELSERKVSQMELCQWLKRKEMYWAQQSHTKWLKEGDKNTR